VFGAKVVHLVVESGAEKQTGIANMKKVWLLPVISAIFFTFYGCVCCDSSLTPRREG
jgi:hypothetical protein